MRKVAIMLTMLCVAAFATQKGKTVAPPKLTGTGFFTDTRDKIKYNTIKIGEQTWMAENLNYVDKEYAKEDSKCYGNKPANCAKYGRLYNWETAMQACPSGWHLPTIEEWDVLTNFAGGQDDNKDEVAEKKLKAPKGWDDNGNGTDDLGFTALPGGHGSVSGNDSLIGIGGRWWSTSGQYRRMNSVFESIPWRSSANTSLFSVRCVKGEPGAEAVAAVAEILKAKAEAAAKAEVRAKAMAAAKAKLDAIRKANGNTFTDTRDKKKYNTIKIGNQVWLAQNLDYADKDSKCYDNKEDNCKIYGRLYTWEAAAEACPAGWHLPDDAEWNKLITLAGGKGGAGTKLKATSGWSNYKERSGNGTEDYGFSAMPGGYGTPDVNFKEVGQNGSWWSATEGEISGSAYHYNFATDSYVGRSRENKSYLYSIRCVQGKSPAEVLKANSGTFADSRDGRKYKTIKIGNQTWMAENLNYNVNGSKCNTSAGCDKYGRLYDWKAAMTSCPSDWHLPTDLEWEVLMATVGGAATAGERLKAKEGWNGGGNGDDDFGFKALPGGSSVSSYGGSGNFGNFWSATESKDNTKANYRHILNTSKNVVSKDDPKTHLFSVRCLQGEPGADAKAKISKIEAEGRK
ncbi:MAG: hypothetical protein LBC64_09585 [Fibromonadaceae bacterium]|nr:hypothetical protein [Fibromonadaceae bacterium]